MAGSQMTNLPVNNWGTSWTLYKIEHTFCAEVSKSASSYLPALARSSSLSLDLLRGLQPAHSATSTALSHCIWANCGFVKQMCRGASTKQEGQGLFTCNLQGFLTKVNLQRLCTEGPYPSKPWWGIWLMVLEVKHKQCSLSFEGHR